MKCLPSQNFIVDAQIPVTFHFDGGTRLNAGGERSWPAVFNSDLESTIFLSVTLCCFVIYGYLLSKYHPLIVAIDRNLTLRRGKRGNIKLQYLKQLQQIDGGHPMSKQIREAVFYARWMNFTVYAYLVVLAVLVWYFNM
jgi:hypothetical protein